MTGARIRLRESLATAALLALVAAATLVPLPAGLGLAEGLTTALSGEQVQVPPADVTLSCPGPLSTQATGVTGSFALAEERAEAQDTVIPLGARQGTGDQTGSVATLQGREPISVLAAGTVLDLTAPLSVLAQVSDPQPGDAAAAPSGAVSYLAPDGDQRGLVSGTCLEPATDQWLVAGDTAVGSTTSVVLDNPGLTTVTVDLEVWGATGAIDAGNSATQVVAAGKSASVVLGAVAAGERRLVVHVSASGGDIAASLTQSRLDGLVPRGVDRALAGAEPARSQVIAGVSLAASEVGDADAGLLRLLAPDASTTAQVRVLGADGQVILRGASSVALTSGQVTDVSLAGVPAGDYTIVVTADQPVVAGARVVRSGAEVTSQEGNLEVSLGTSADFAWLPSDALPTASASGTVAIPHGVAGTVVIGSVPDLDSAAGLAALADVPVSYGTGSADAATASPAVNRGTILAYDSAGSVVGRQPIALPRAGTATVVLSALAPGKEVAAISVTSEGSAATDDSRLAWTVLTTASSVAGSVGVLTPRAATSSATSIMVKAADSFD